MKVHIHERVLAELAEGGEQTATAIAVKLGWPFDRVRATLRTGIRRGTVTARQDTNGFRPRRVYSLVQAPALE